MITLFNTVQGQGLRYVEWRSTEGHHLSYESSNGYGQVLDVSDQSQWILRDATRQILMSDDDVNKILKKCRIVDRDQAISIALGIVA